MHNPYWLFSGPCNVPKKSDAGDAQGGRVAFDINTFVRSLNRNAIQLPDALKNSRLEDEKRIERPSTNLRKSLNDFLSVLDDSLDRAIDGNQSATSSFASFRSNNDEKDANAWKELINLVSTTTHEFRDIRGNDKNARDPERVEKMFQKPEIKDPFQEERQLRNSENNVLRVGQLEPPVCFLNELLRISGRSVEKSSSSWMTLNARMNFDDSTTNCEMSPYCAGGAGRICIRSKLAKNSSASASHSSPIFVDETRRGEIITSKGESLDSVPSSCDKEFDDDKNAETSLDENEKKIGARVKLLVKRGRKYTKSVSRKSPRKKLSPENEESSLSSESRTLLVSPRKISSEELDDETLALVKRDRSVETAIGVSKNEVTNKLKIRVTGKNPKLGLNTKNNERVSKDDGIFRKSPTRGARKVNAISDSQDERKNEISRQTRKSRTNIVENPSSPNVPSFLRQQKTARNQGIQRSSRPSTASRTTRLGASTSLEKFHNRRAPIKIETTNSLKNANHARKAQTPKERIVKSVEVGETETRSSKNGNPVEKRPPCVLKSKTFVQTSGRDVASRAKCTKGAQSEIAPTKRSQDAPSAMKQIFRKTSKNAGIRKESSETNFTNTDTESVITNNVGCSADCESDSPSDKSRTVKKICEATKVSTENVARERHTRSLRMLKNILSHQGVDVENVKRDAIAIRSKISTNSEKKSQFSLSTVRTEASMKSELEKGSKNIPKTSKTLFEKLALLAETQPSAEDVSNRSVTKKTSSASKKSTKSRESVKASTSNKISQSSICEVEQKAMSVDAAISPLPSIANLSEGEIAKNFEAAETQTQTSGQDKDSMTERTSRSLVDVSTETLATTTAEASIDCCLRECKISKDAISGKDWLDVPSISREVNTESPDVKSRGVCFRGARKQDDATVVSLVNFKDTASGKDFVEPQPVSKLVNTDRLDYLHVDRSVEMIGPEITENACQVVCETTDVGIGECSQLVCQSSTSVDASRESEPPCLTSSLVLWQETPVPEIKLAQDFLKMQLEEKTQNFQKAIEIYQETLAAERRNQEGEETKNISPVNIEEDAKIKESTLESPTNIQDSPIVDSQTQVAIVMENIISGVMSRIEVKNACRDCRERHEKKLKSPSSESDSEPDDSEIIDKNKFSLLSRNSLLTFVYGTVCSLVFWALQFSISCDSLVHE